MRLYQLSTLCLLLLFCAELLAQNDFNIGVIPTPQSVLRCEGNITIDARPVEVYNEFNRTTTPKNRVRAAIPLRIFKVNAIDNADNQSQAYRLVIQPSSVDIYAVDTLGVRYARTTLHQIFQLHQGNVPCVEIIDYPAFAHRVFFDDLSRGPITSPAYRMLQMQEGLALKYNFGSYYTEHVAYNANYPDIAPIDGLQRHDEVFNVYANHLQANLQCFAHFEKTLSIPFYEPLMDTRYNLNPNNEQTYTFLRQQVANAAALYPKSKYFNINCDETEALGSGRARDAVAATGVDETYIRHINKVDEIIRSHGYTTLMWGDIVSKNPEMLKHLAADIQYIIWSYVPAESFDNMIAPFQQAKEERGTQFWVAGGVSHWSNVFPSIDDYIYNLAHLARDGHKAGAIGFYNTAWDDSGESLYGDALHAIAWGAEMAWKPLKTNDPKELAERERRFNDNYNKLYGIDNISDIIYAVGALKHNPWVGEMYNTGALYDPLFNFYPTKVNEEAIVRYIKVISIVDSIQQQYHIDALDSTANYQTSLHHAAYALRRIRLTAQKQLLSAQIYQVLQGKASADELLQQARNYQQALHALKCQYLRLWDYESTQYSREMICKRYDDLGREAQAIATHVFIEQSTTNNEPVITMKTINPQADIYYTLDGLAPTEGSTLYREPLHITQSCMVQAISYNQWGEGTHSSRYVLKHLAMGRLMQLNARWSTYREVYSGGGVNALVDGQLGSNDSYMDGHWQGFAGQDIDIMLDLTKNTKVQSVTMRFLQNTNDWILAPQQIDIYTSTDGKNWQLIQSGHFNPDYHQSGNVVRTNLIDNLNINTRYLRIIARNPGALPDWSPGRGHNSYLFSDEVIVQ